MIFFFPPKSKHLLLSGWMDVCYSFDENYEKNIKPSGEWEGFEEAIEEAKIFKKTGQFVSIPIRKQDSSEEEDINYKKRELDQSSSDDDYNIEYDSDKIQAIEDDSVDSNKELKPKKTIRRKRVKISQQKRNLWKEIFNLIQDCQKSIKNQDFQNALDILNKFDPKSKNENFSKLDSQDLFISRLGKFIHHLKKSPEQSISSFSNYLYTSYLNKIKSELQFDKITNLGGY